VESVHGTVKFTLQKQKIYCTYLLTRLLFICYFKFKFLAGSMRNKLNNIIKLTYYLPHRLTRNIYNKNEYQNLNQKHFQKSQTQEEFPLKFVKKVKSNPLVFNSATADATADSMVKYEWSEVSRTEVSPCDRICKGKKKMLVKFVCTKDKKRVNENFCPSARSNVQYSEETCNNDCDLK
jgi:hypothetical protein